MNDDPKPERSPERSFANKALRLFRIAAGAVLAAEALYLLAMNLFLSTPLFEKAIDGTPLIVDIHYERGWSLFPTRIHARGLSIRGTDSHVEWILRFAEVEFDCSLLALARQQFHVTRARGSGITFRARMKVASPEATAALVSYLPPIDSLGPVGFIPSEPTSPALWDDSAWHLWTVQIDDAIAEHVREVWIEGGRLQGDARVAGGFRLKPMRSAYIGPAHVEVRSGAVSWRARTVAEPLVAGIDFELSEFDPRFAESTDLLPRLSISVNATTVIPDLDSLGLQVPGSGSLHGRVDVSQLALRVAEGVVRDGTHLGARTDRAVVTTGGHEVSGAADVTADVTRGALAVQALLTGVDADATLTVPRATLAVDSSALDLEDALGDLHAILDVPGAEVAQATRIMNDVPAGAPLRIDDGSLSGSLHVEAWRAEHRARGSLGLKGKLGVEYAGCKIDLDLVAHARAHAAPWDSAALSFDDAGLVATHLVLHGAASAPALSVGRVSIAAASPALARWDLRHHRLGGAIEVSADDVTGRFDERPGAPDFTADRIDARASAEAFDLVNPSMAGVDYAVRVGHAELGDARSLNRFLPSPTILAVESGRAELSADFATSGARREARGQVDLAIADGGIRLHDTRLSGDFDVVVHAHGFDPAKAAVDLEGSRMEMRNVRVSGASTDTSAWSGELVLQAGTLGLAPQPRLEGDLTLEARDASPLLAILFHDSLPGFVADLTRMPSFTAVTHVAVEPQLLAVSDLLASGGDLAIRGTYVLHGAKRDAAFVIQKGPLSAGLSLDDDGSHLRLFGLNGWYVDHSRQALAPR